MSTQDIGVVVPAHNAATDIGACLDAVLAAGAEPAAVLVVDDGSRDATAAIAEGRGVSVLRNATPLRPARARNAGVAGLDRAVVLFVDADVVLHVDAIERVAAHFAADPGLAAVFGSYDAAPPAPTLVSRYRNLLHHFTHQTGDEGATTFWTGLGAVRRATFRAHGGFDAAWEDIEDVEFGLRLSAAGERIRLDPAIRGTHLKHWSLRSMLRTDLRGRAVPWSRLLRLRRTAAGDLGTSLGARISAATLPPALVALVAAPFAPGALWVLAAMMLVFLGANARFLAFLARERGLLFAAGAVPVHAMHYAAGLGGYALVRLRALRPAPPR